MKHRLSFLCLTGLFLVVAPSAAMATGMSDSIFLLLGFFFAVAPVGGLLLLIALVSFLVGRSEELSRNQALYVKVIEPLTMGVVGLSVLGLLGFAVSLKFSLEILGYVLIHSVCIGVLGIPALMLNRGLMRRIRSVAA